MYLLNKILSMKKITILIALIGAISLGGFSQASSYAFTAVAGTYDTLVAGTNVPAIEADYAISGLLPIGFSFTYDGVSYDSLKAASDGFLSFNPSAGATGSNDLDNTSASRRPLIAALWDDLDGNATGGVSYASYLTTGTAPNRVFTFEWKNWEWRWNSNTPTMSFQVKLYETSNIVKLVYKQEAGTVSSGTASIGLSGVSSFLSLDGSGTSPSASSTSETSNISAKPATGQVYSFTPPSCPAPGALTASDISYDSVEVSWTGTGSNWIIEYDTNGFTLGSGTTIISSTNPDTISGLAAETNYSYYVRSFCAVGDSSLWVGPFNFTTLPTCPAPSALAVSSVMTTSANLDWTENGSATSWDIEWDTAGFTSTGVPTITGSTTNPHSLSGLTSNTSYEFYVRASCSATDSSAWAGPFTFATSCGAVTSFPYTENFDGSLNSGVWSCWTVVNNDNDSYTWRQGNTYITPTHSPLYAAYGSGNGDDYLITPQLTVGATAIRVKFWDIVENSGYNNTYTVRVSTTGTNPADFTDSITTIDCSNTAWLEHVISLSAYTNQSIYVAFHQTFSTSSGWGFGIDDFTAEIIPSCTEPDTLMASNATTSGADLYWTEMGTAALWDLEIVASGVTPTGTPTNSALTSDSVTISTLSSATAYDYYVRADCGGATSPWSGPYTFNTLCSDVTVFPYTEDFDGSLNSGVWNCWTVVNNDADAFTWSQSNTYISPTHSGSYAAHGMGNADDYLITPQFTLGATAIRVKFWDKVESATRNNTYTIKVSTTGTNPADFTDSITTIDCSNTSWLAHTVDLSAYTNQSIYVAFHQTYSGATNYGFGIDDFTAELIPTCPQPSLLNVASVTVSSASLSWTENGTATTWDIEWDTAGFTSTGVPTVTGSTTNPHALTGLTSNTSYEYYVRSSCSATDSSIWVGPYSFTTPCNPYSIPFIEGFESGYTDQTTVAGCLSQESVTGTQTWFANSSLTTYNRTPRTGSFNATIRYGNEDWIFIPVNLVSGTSYTSSVYARQDGTGTTNASVMIAFGSANTAASMTDTIVAPVGIDNNYQLVSGAFTPSSTGLYYVGIKGKMNFSPWYISIDDIEIKLSPVDVSVVVVPSLHA